MTTTLPHAPTRRRDARPVGEIITLATAAVTLATAAVGRSAHGQDCRLDYQRAAATGPEQLTLGADQVQELAREGGGVRALANRGGAPLALALVGASLSGYQSVSGSTVVQTMGGVSGGVLRGGSGPSSYGGVSGGVLKGAADHVATLGGSWITLQPGQHVEGLQHDLAAVACGAANPITRAIVAASASR